MTDSLGGAVRWLRSPRAAIVAAVVALGCAVATWCVAPPRGAIAELFGTPTFEGPRLLYRIVPTIDPRLIVRDAAAPRESSSARWTASWWIPRDADVEIEAAADDRAALSIDARRIVTPAADPGIQHSSATVHLTRGFHLLTAEYEQLDGGMFLDILVASNGAAARPIAEEPIYATKARQQSRWPTVASRVFAFAAILGALVAIASVAARGAVPHARAASLAALGLVMLLGGALRLDALLGRIGPVDQPAWLQSIDRDARLPLSRLAPVRFQWVRVPRMYHEGDPAGYLHFAREMQHFYAAHPREPLFIAMTRALLPLVAQQDVAVGLASMLSSLLLIAATYLLGAALASRFTGLAAAFALAIERDAIAWSVEGWRDELFAVFFVLSAWLFLRLSRRADVRTATALGVVCAGALLTRVTSLSFLLAGAATLVIGARTATTPVRRRAGLAILTISMALVLAGPYFVNCARAFGDPLYSIDVHTRFYRDRQGQPSRTALGAGSYVRSRFVENPVRLTGTFIVGMTGYPFLNKWHGFDDWSPLIAPLAAGCSLIGLLLLASRPDGRRLLVISAASLVPYAFTHDIQGGAEWRFTMHVYPILLIAAALAIEAAAGAAPAWRQAPHAVRQALRLHGARIAIATAVILVAAFLTWSWPYVEMAEDLWFNRPFSVLADDDYALLFSRTWSEPVQAGNVISRSTVGPTGTLWVPIVRKRAHQMRLRLDPTGREPSGSELRVLVNGTLLSTASMQRVEGRIGAYDVVIPDSALHLGFNRVDLEIAPTGSASDDEHTPGIRLWYVRLSAM